MQKHTNRLAQLTNGARLPIFAPLLWHSLPNPCQVTIFCLCAAQMSIQQSEFCGKAQQSSRHRVEDKLYCSFVERKRPTFAITSYNRKSTYKFFLKSVKAMKTQPAITARDLTRRFGKTVAVDRLNLEVNAGEIFGFLGHNGAGKTTTVRLLNGVLSPNG